jgi:excisionase family DNA binding protein
MAETKSLSFDRLLELLAEKLAAKLSREPSRLYPRLFTTAQAAVYLGRPRDAVEHLLSSGIVPRVLIGRETFIDRIDLDRWIEEHKTGWIETPGGSRHGS